MEKVRIIKARREHIPRIVEMWKDFMDFHAAIDPLYTRGDKAHVGYERHLLKSIGSRKAQVFVVLVNNVVAGYAYIEIAKYPPVYAERHFGYLNDMYVSPEYRRKGLGELMFKAVLAWSAARKLKFVELGVAAQNRIAGSFWRKMGFADRMIRMYTEI